MTTETIEIVARDGARATVARHGGQVLGWRCAHDAVERLYLSPKADLSVGASIRGGVPVCFPQFANRGELPKHGFARNLSWRTVAQSSGDDGSASARLSLADDATTHALWPFAFETAITVAVGGDALHIALEVSNRAAATFAFTAALHTYLAVPDILHTRIRGLDGFDYCDTADGSRMKRETASEISFGGEVDRIYASGAAPVAVVAPGQRVDVASRGFADTVVWNPGPAVGASIADLPPGGWRHYVCVEAAAALAPVSLGSGETWQGSQTMRVVRGPVDARGSL